MEQYLENVNEQCVCSTSVMLWLRMFREKSALKKLQRKHESMWFGFLLHCIHSLQGQVRPHGEGCINNTINPCLHSLSLICSLRGSLVTWKQVFPSLTFSLNLTYLKKNTFPTFPMSISHSLLLLSTLYSSPPFNLHPFALAMSKNPLSHPLID